MQTLISRICLSCMILFSLPLFGQVHQVRHSRYPNSPSNDPQL